MLLRSPCLIHVSLVLFVLIAGSALAKEPGSPDGFPDPGPNRADEPIAASFSMKKAVAFLDHAAVDWQESHGCMTCHTNYAYLYARPLVDANSDSHKSVREFAEQLVDVRWTQRGPRGDHEVVATAAALAFNDHQSSGKLHPATRKALDKMWTVQRPDGGFDWLKCGWPPMESDDHYGATLAAIAVGCAPMEYADTPQAKKGMAKLRVYFRQNPPPEFHHKLMLVWASHFSDNLITARERTQTLQQLVSLQRDDGGWSLATLGKWQRADGKTQSTDTSDGYATGFATYLLQLENLANYRPAIGKGIRWLKLNQRESGRWFTRSLHHDGSHYISHAGSAMAVMALAEFERGKD